MEKPKINSVWKSVSGRIVLIVGNPVEPAVLWLDDITGELTVSPVLNRLAEQIESMSVQDFFEHISQPHEETSRCPSCSGNRRTWDSFGRLNECGRCDGEGRISTLRPSSLLNNKPTPRYTTGTGTDNSIFSDDNENIPF